MDLPSELLDHPQYEVLRELGRGGMGVVYLARNRLMAREEVLKVLPADQFGRKVAGDRFLREIQSAARLNHPNVVAAHSAFWAGDTLVFVMEYAPGTDLRQLVKQHGPLPLANACLYTAQAAQGLRHAHERGMVHRDIKPSNLILTTDGRKPVVKVLDFGLAKARSSTNPDGSGPLPSAPTLTAHGLMLGTPEFMAPEQITDAVAVDHRADIYALGLTLYYLLAGRSPFNAANLSELLDQQLLSPLPKLRAKRVDVPAGIDELLAQMTAKRPEDRLASVAEVGKALAGFCKTGVVALVPSTPAVGTALQPVVREPEDDIPVASRVTVAPAGMVPHRTRYLNADDFDPPPRPGAEVKKKKRKKKPEQLAVARNVIACVAGLVGLVLAVGLYVAARRPVSAGSLTAATVSTSKDAPISTAPSASVKPPPTTLDAPTASTSDRSPPADTGDFVKLFDGQTLAGWIQHPSFLGDWRVTDGKIVGRQTGGPSYLFTENEYTNFHLKVRVRGTPGLDSGVFVRAGFGPCPVPGQPGKAFASPEGCEFNYSTVSRETGRFWINSLGQPGGRQLDTPPDVACEFDVVADGRRVRGWVNGQQVYDCDRVDIARGRIAIQLYHPPGGNQAIFVESVRIKEFGSSPAGPRWVPLFDGTTLDPTIWYPARAGTSTAPWEVKDGLLTCRTGPNQVSSLQTVRESFRNLELRVEAAEGGGGVRHLLVRRRREGKPPIGYRVILSAQMPKANPPGTIARMSGMDRQLAAGREPLLGASPFTARVRAVGGRIESFIDSLPRATFDDPDNPWSAGAIELFIGQNSSVRYRRVEVRELPD